MEDAPPFRNGDTAKAAKYAESKGLMRIERGGERRASQHFAVDPKDCSPLLPTAPGEHPASAPTAPYRGADAKGADGQATAPATGVAS